MRCCHEAHLEPASRPGCPRGLSALPLLAPGAGARRPLPKLTLERLHAEPPLVGLAAHAPRLAPGRQAADLPARAPARRPACVRLDVTKGEQTLLLDAREGPGCRARSRGRCRSPSASWLPDGRTLLVPADGDIFTVDVATAAVRALVQTPETEEFAEASPDGSARRLRARERPLRRRRSPPRRETRLTQDGSDTLLNGRLDWVYEEELASRSGQAFVWSPDSRALAYLQLDQARVPTFPIVDFLPVRNEVRVAALSEGRLAERRRPRRRRRHRQGRRRRPRAARRRPARRRLPAAAARLDARLARRRLPAAQPGAERARAAAAAGPSSPREPLGSAAHAPDASGPRPGSTPSARRASSRTAGASCGSPSATASRTSTCATSRAAAGPSRRGRGRSTRRSPSPARPGSSSSTSAAGSSTSPPPRRTRASGTSTACASTAPAARG